MTDRITINVYRTSAEGKIQVQIAQTDENGLGTGYRLAGPKHYNSGVTELLTHEVDDRDAAEIRGYLDAVFPQPAPEQEEPDCGDEGDSDSDVFALIAEIASRLSDATDEGEYQAANLIRDLANGTRTIAEARAELADITFRHV